MAYKGIVLPHYELSSKKLVKLLAYLAYFHNREVSSSELVEMLWEKESLKNPKNTLKNLIYRLRKSLGEYWEEDFLVATANGYKWNSKLRTIGLYFLFLCKESIVLHKKQSKKW